MLPLALALAAGALVLFFAFRCQDVFFTVFPKRLSELTAGTLPGTWVEDDVFTVYSAYAREADYRGGELSKIRGVHYVIAFGEEQYMGLFVRGEAMERAQEMLEAGGLAGALHVKGMVRPMDGQTLSMYRAAAGGDPAVEAVMLPFYLDADRVNGRAPAFLWCVLAVCILLMSLGIALVIWTVTWGGQKKLLAKAAQLGELDKVVEKLGKFWDETRPIGGVRLSDQYLLFQDGLQSVLCRPWELGWVYRKPARLPGEKRSFLTFRMMDGSRHTLLMSEYDARCLMNELGEKVEGLELGWSRGLAKAFREDRESFSVKH